MGSQSFCLAYERISSKSDEQALTLHIRSGTGRTQFGFGSLYTPSVRWSISAISKFEWSNRLYSNSSCSAIGNLTSVSAPIGSCFRVREAEEPGRAAVLAGLFPNLAKTDAVMTPAAAEVPIAFFCNGVLMCLRCRSGSGTIHRQTEVANGFPGTEEKTVRAARQRNRYSRKTTIKAVGWSPDRATGAVQRSMVHTHAGRTVP